MEAKTITNDLSVSGQITVDDVTQLKQAGTKSIICNRPDHEDLGQPEFAAIAAAAGEQGLEIRFMPVVSSQLTGEKGAEFARLTAELPKPVHAYCRSGTRCTILWALAELNADADREQVIRRAAGAGYDLSKTI